MDGDGDLILAAQTASGKTEAAFLPILSRIVEEPAEGVRAVYAGPLKALINDQWSRLDEVNLPVPRIRVDKLYRHGDRLPACALDRIWSSQRRGLPLFLP